ncbi:hypothetical protein JW766_03520 [Candidatus Dojkabacteria bacterium]|nr:hypothetical protein [Candidatus Dojkabacteria bacterium]
MANKKWVHFIGICGVTMAPLANMFKKKGWSVSGSDKGIFPPMSDYLKARKIDIQLGFKEEHLTKGYYSDKRKKQKASTRCGFASGENRKYPDIVVVGNYIGLNNPEFRFAKKNDLQIRSFPEVLEEHLVKSNSIVTAGTYGKTTTTALLALILEKAEMNPSYMIGGIAENFKDGIKNTRSEWSIIEGDEYITARFDQVSKFFHYKPEFLLFTACAWDHTDFYKTREDYVENFRNLLRSLPHDGLVVANRRGENVLEVLEEARCKVVTYELNKIDEHVAKADWFNLSHKENREIGEIIVFNRHTKEEFSVKTKLIGDHNRENIVGCAALARELSIDTEPIQEAVSAFKGIKRRLEVRYSEGNLRIIDDFASSPSKAKGSLQALRGEFSDWHITIIFEPNVGNRTFESMEMFERAFDEADEVIIPHLKPVKTEKGDKRLSGEELVENLKRFGYQVKYMDNDIELVKYVSGKDVGKHIICFMGSYGWRRMIEEVIEKFN